MNRAYDIADGRPWWKRRLVAIALTAGLALFILTAFALIVAGPWLADVTGRELGLGPAFAWTWKILQWPVVFFIASTGFGLVYYVAPDAEQEWAWITPGALTATVLWFLSSLVFRYYVVNFGNYDAAYGTLGAIILTLLWFYLSGLAMVMGAELNAEIHRASPWGRNPGPKIMGQRMRLGLAASREWFTRHNRAEGPAISPV
jgi:membrane protein